MKVTEILKAGSTGGVGNPTAEELEEINKLSLRALTAEEVFVFKVNACDDQVDRDFEHFTVGALKKLSALLVGKTFIFDHNWTAGNQVARIFSAKVKKDGDAHRLQVMVYMLRSDETAPLIDKIEAGILKEVSIGCSVSKATCDICGQPYSGCQHRRGENYNGKSCSIALDDPFDAYELSFVAVPCQREAGVTKGVQKAEGVAILPGDAAADEVSATTKEIQRKRALARIALIERINKI